LESLNRKLRKMVAELKVGSCRRLHHLQMLYCSTY
jgi:hypothetical protein